MTARIKKGDTVVVISGKDKGKQGEIIAISREDSRVIVKDVNKVKRHTKPTPKDPQGGIIEREAPLHMSKVMPVDPTTGKGTRVRVKDQDGKKVRIAKSGSAI